MTEQKVTFREISEKDAKIFFTMAEEFYHSPAVLHPVPSLYHSIAFSEMMRSHHYLEGYIFEYKDQAVGFAVTNRMMQHEMGGIVVWVEELYIRPSYQGKGLGSFFLRWLETKLQGKAAAIRLETEPENTRARVLYERLGYSNIGYQQMIKKLPRKES